MKQFETDLKIIQSECSSKDFLLDSALSIPLPRLRFLKSMGLIEIKPFADNHLRIILTDAGTIYFFTKAQRHRQTITQWSINLLVAVLSAMFGSGFTLILQCIITK